MGISSQAPVLDCKRSGEVILVAGLPGSGKTTRLSQMFRDGWLVFDDFKGDAFEDCSRFGSSRKFLPLILALRSGLRCAVADIDFCRTESREEAEGLLLATVPGLKLRWHFFQNDRSACEANIRSRDRDCTVKEKEVGYLQKYSPAYSIPHGAVVLAVSTNRCVES